MDWSRPRGHVPTGRADSPCDNRPAEGSAWPRPGPARTGLPTREEEKKIKRTAGKDRDRGPAVVNRGMGALARSPRRAENRRYQRLVSGIVDGTTETGETNLEY